MNNECVLLIIYSSESDQAVTGQASDGVPHTYREASICVPTNCCDCCMTLVICSPLLVSDCILKRLNNNLKAIATISENMKAF